MKLPASFIKMLFLCCAMLLVVFVMFPDFAHSDTAKSSAEKKIIPITSAVLLDSHKIAIRDIYAKVKAQDKIFVTVKDSQYVRVTFEKKLTKINDIIVRAKSAKGGKITVYQKDGAKALATMGNIKKVGDYQALLKDLAQPADTFDLLISGAVDIDFIVDPSGGPNSGSYFANDASIGSQAWLAPSALATSNDVFADVMSAGATSNYLIAEVFGFSIPTDATITGIVVEYEKSRSGGTSVVDNAVRIIKGYNIGSTDRSNGSDWPTTDTYVSYGSSSDLWGETWTPSDINSNGFGVAISATVTSAQAQIDHVRITVYYNNAIDISGTVYSDEGVTNIGSGKTVAVSINGAAAAGTNDTDSNGAYSLTGLPINAGDVLTLYLDGETEKAVTVTVASGSNQTGVNLYQNDLVVRNDNGGSLTSNNLDTADNNGDSDITAIYTVSLSLPVVAAGKSLFIPASQTFAPGTDLSIGGSFTNNGTYTTGFPHTLNLTGTSSHVIKTNGSTIYALQISGGGTYTMQDAITLTDRLTISGGATTLDTSSGGNYSITLGGNWNNSGIFTARNSTVTLNGVDQTITGTTTFYNLTKQETTNDSTNKTLTFNAGTTTTISHNLTLDGLDSNDKLAIISSSSGSAATIDFTGSSTFSTTGFLSVKDNTATDNSSGITLPLSPANSTNVSNTTGWFSTPYTFDQKYFRFYRDNTTLNTADPYAAQNTNYNPGPGTIFRLRIEIANTGSAAGNIVRRLEFKEDAGAWTQITTGTNNVRLADSTNFTDAAATTSRLTATGSFQAGQGKDTGSDTSSLSLTNGNYTEDEFSLKLESGASGHTYTFRITNAGTPLDTYTVTPGINTVDVTPPVPSGFNPATTSTIKTATPNITFNLDEAGDCKASTTNASYAAMTGANCTGDGSTSGACLMPSLGSNGSKTIYFACQDTWGNQDSSLTTHSVTYTLDASSGNTPMLIIKGSGKIKGSGVLK